MNRKSAGLFVVFCLMAALFAFPAFAQAADATIEGTATLGGVAPTSGYAEIFVYDANDEHWDHYDGEMLDAGGAFSFSVEATETYFVRAANSANTVEAVTAAFATTDGQVKPLVLALAKEMFGPDPRNSEFSSWPWTDSENYTNEDVPFTLTTYDEHRHFRRWFDGSGVATMSYSINGGAFVEKAQVSTTENDLSVVGTFTADGVNTIKFFAVDRNGNVGRTATRLVYIDKTAPMTSYNMAAATGQTIMLVGTDSGSGVAGTLWRIGGTGEFKPGNLVSVPATGVSTLEFYSVDEAGNAEAVKSMTIQAKASLTKPKASTSKPRAGKTFYVRGAVTGRPLAVGTLKVFKVVNGKYKYVSKKSFKASSTGSYKVAFKLKKGKYRFKAFYGWNTAASSNPPATSAYSARSTVR